MDELVESPWMTIDQAARYLQVSVSSIRIWISKGRMPAHKNGRVVRLHRQELDNWLRYREQARESLEESKATRKAVKSE